jgi:hypothetical protein
VHVRSEPYFLGANVLGMTMELEIRRFGPCLSHVSIWHRIERNRLTSFYLSLWVIQNNDKNSYTYNQRFESSNLLFTCHANLGKSLTQILVKKNG